MEMPRPTPEHQRLARLAGIWQGKETMYPSQWDPQGSTADAEIRARVALGEFVVVSDYRQSRGGQVTFEGHGVYSLDPKNQRQVLLHWFDSIGQGLEEFRGGWQGDKLVISSQNPQGHARLTYDYSKPGALSSMMEMSADGKTWKKLFDGSYRRAD